MLQNRQNAEIL